MSDQTAKSETDPIELKQNHGLLALIRKRWSTFLIGFAGVFLLLAYIVLSQKPKYACSFSIYVEPKKQFPMSFSQASQAEQPAEENLVMAILRGADCRRQIVGDCHLIQRTEFWASGFRLPGLGGSKKKSLAAAIRKLNETTVVKGDRGVISLEVVTIDPNLSFEVAGAFLRYAKEKLLEKDRLAGNVYQARLEVANQKLSDINKRVIGAIAAGHVPLSPSATYSLFMKEVVDVSARLEVSKAEHSRLQAKLDAPADPPTYLALQSNNAGEAALSEHLVSTLQQKHADALKLTTDSVELMNLLLRSEIAERVVASEAEQAERQTLREKIPSNPYTIIDTPFKQEEAQPRGASWKLAASLIIAVIAGVVASWVRNRFSFRVSN